jgi:hypothetical protein
LEGFVNPGQWRGPFRGKAVACGRLHYQKGWFVVFRIIPDIGISDIRYIFFYQRNKKAPPRRGAN